MNLKGKDFFIGFSVLRLGLRCRVFLYYYLGEGEVSKFSAGGVAVLIPCVSCWRAYLNIIDFGFLCKSPLFYIGLTFCVVSRVFTVAIGTRGGGFPCFDASARWLSAHFKYLGGRPQFVVACPHV